MPLRRKRNAGSAKDNDEPSREMRRNRLTHLIQQFEKEAQERMNELEDRLDNMLSTVDRVFKVELMKLPPSLQNTLIGDLMSEQEISASDVSIAMKNESLQMQQSLKRASSKRVKSTDSTPVPSASGQRSSNKNTKTVNGTKRTKALVGSNSTGNLRGSTISSKRTLSRVTKASEHSTHNKPKLRSVVSTGDLHCSMAGSAAHITVTTAEGQTLSFSEETKDEINLELLDDVAWYQIERLTSVMEYLARQNRSLNEKTPGRNQQGINLI